ncbi:isoprenylcysteine carboxylmethyltransferase family protein [Bacillus sp. KH172YL63]|uniref:isoprenylcysteine carboxyl methyltransferase family protein n=1 Tax=Bacillus sp. KH172YL63 TaxID=2709784 RepID=UPI0015667DEF|nr:isoprenylcysteine carboxylmethyltransferase family protein [Bacillus sp. KH172YL63]
MYFFLFFSVLIIQRIVEVVIAKSNEKWMIRQGAKEYGQAHYKLMVAIHVAFFISLLIEGGIKESGVNSYWPFLLCAFLITQIMRIWVITSLGKYWNTKIIVLPNAESVNKGPYKYLKHPNYLIVTIELIIVPLLFNAYWTMFIFALLNQLILSVRIPLEEKALRNETDYGEVHIQTKGWGSLMKKEK